MEAWAVVAAAMLAGAAYAFFVGEDINWDWRNYHEYGAFALLNGRFDVDVAPGGLQGYLNPLVYVPSYLLRHYVGPPFWGMLLGAIHGLNLALIYWFSRQVLGKAANGWTLAASVVIAASGPMTLSEVGTSFSDLLTALPVIAGLGLVLSATAQQPARYVVAGLLIGGAVGLKLTNAIFFIGAAASMLFAARPLVAMSCFLVGGAVGARSLILRTRLLTRRDLQFLLFFLVAYGMWLFVFAIHRYAIVLELLAAPLIVLLISRVLRALRRRSAQRSRWIEGTAIVAALAVVLWSQPADWFHRPWSDPYRPHLSGSFLTPATYLLIEKPVGYVVPLLAGGSRAYQLADILLPVVHGGSLDRRIRAGLANSLPGGVWAIYLRGSAPRADLIEGYGLRFDASRPCETIPGADDVDIEACPLVAAGPSH